MPCLVPNQFAVRLIDRTEVNNLLELPLLQVGKIIFTKICHLAKSVALRGVIETMLLWVKF